MLEILNPVPKSCCKFPQHPKQLHGFFWIKYKPAAVGGRTTFKTYTGFKSWDTKELISCSIKILPRRLEAVWGAESWGTKPTLNCYKNKAE